MSEMTKRHPLLILTPDQALRRELQGIFADFDVVSGETSEQILARLSHRFDLLVSQRRDLSARHRTLWAALDWSYRLLSPPRKRGPKFQCR